MKKNAKNPIGFLYMVKKIYPLCFKAKPSYFLYIQAISVIHALLYGIGVLVNQSFFDSVNAVFTGKGSMSFALIMLATYVATYILRNIIDSMADFSVDTNIQRTIGYMNLKIAEKSSIISPIEFENPERLDDINKATNGARAAVLFQNTISIVTTFYIPYFAFISVYLLKLQPMLLLAVMVVFIPKAIAQLLRSTVFTKLEDEAAPLRREFNEYYGAIVSAGSIKELRSLGAFGYFKKLMTNALDETNKKIWEANIRSTVFEAIFNFMTLLGYCGVLFLLIYYLINGGISVGAFAAIYGSIWTVFGMMDHMISWRIATLAEGFGQIRNFLRFIDMPVMDRSDINVNKKGDIVLSNVSFKYPNNEKDCLSDINLTIRSGETVALVGENGAGKTTLVKVLTGLYCPVIGKVTVGDVDISKVSYRVLFEGISGVFQKYQRYMMTLEENVKIADHQSGIEISESLEKGGVDISNAEKFPQGKDTVLSREFGGVELSGGEWQRVSIARGFYRKSDIIILDEPTAAIDPILESVIYRKFVTIARGKTAIIVTHRLGSAKIADRIIAMKDGKIVQIGTHNELIASGGIYADMFYAQAKWYENNDETVKTLNYML